MSDCTFFLKVVLRHVLNAADIQLVSGVDLLDNQMAAHHFKARISHELAVLI